MNPPKLLVILGLTLSVVDQGFARNVYLNGIDITSARNQLMEGVTIRIDGDGNFFIEGSHYQVNEENTYVPLSSWNHDLSKPKHQAQGQLPMNPDSIPLETIESLKSKMGGTPEKPGVKQDPEPPSAQQPASPKAPEP